MTFITGTNSLASSGTEQVRCSPSSAAGKEPYRTALPDHALIAGRVQ